jgi:hypothetical protein
MSIEPVVYDAPPPPTVTEPAGLSPEAKWNQAKLMHLIINASSITTMAVATAVLITQDNLRPLLPYVLTFEIIALTVLNVVFGKQVKTLETAYKASKRQNL